MAVKGEPITDKDRLKERVPMSELAARRGLTTMQEGIIQCPHCRMAAAELEEKDRGYWCAPELGGCSTSGDQLDALMVLERTDFRGALSLLADMAADIEAEAGRKAAGQGRLL